MVSLGKQVNCVAVWDFKWDQKTTVIFKRLFYKDDCAWKRQVITSSEHIREASLTSVDLHHSVQWDRSLASGSYTQSNLLAPSAGLKTTLLSHNFMAGFTQCFVSLTLQNLETVLLTLTYISNDFAND